MFSCFYWLDIHSDIVGYFMLLLVDSAFIWFTVYVDDLSFLVLQFGFSLGDASSLSMLVTCLFLGASIGIFTWVVLWGDNLYHDKFLGV